MDKAWNSLYWDNQKLIVACNFTDQEQPCKLFDEVEGEEVISNYKVHKMGLLRPYEARVILLYRKMHGGRLWT